MTDRTNDSPMPKAQSERIRDLNDRFRRFELSGTHVATPSIINMGPQAVRDIMLAVASFNDFTADNDPYGEHDFGDITYNDQRIFWKIDYYNRDMSAGSEDPANPQLTTRVMTVFLASEY
ncbi:DUF3768 domain-containing protein [Rhodobacteraceae bacterium G21628-S1]|nr:DUF3768 domain-containing protein [Rhodobacteraceae bacterium G21628-S1]